MECAVATSDLRLVRLGSRLRRRVLFAVPAARRDSAPAGGSLSSAGPEESNQRRGPEYRATRAAAPHADSTELDRYLTAKAPVRPSHRAGRRPSALPPSAHATDVRLARRWARVHRCSRSQITMQARAVSVRCRSTGSWVLRPFALVTFIWALQMKVTRLPGRNPGGVPARQTTDPGEAENQTTRPPARQRTPDSEAANPGNAEN